MTKDDIEGKIADYETEIRELRDALSGASGWRREAIAEKIGDFLDAIEDLREMLGEVEL